MKPCWGLVESLMRGVCWIRLLLGPIFSLQAWSIKCVEMCWAQFRLVFGIIRCIIEGK